MQERLGLEKKRAQAKKATAGKKGGPKKKRITVRQFLTEVRAELKKVTWPTREEVTSYTVVVLITVTLLGSLIYLADYIFTNLVKVLILR